MIGRGGGEGIGRWCGGWYCIGVVWLVIVIECG